MQVHVRFDRGGGASVVESGSLARMKRFALATLGVLVTSGACGSSCPQHTGDDLVDGSASLTLLDTNETFAQDAFAWDGNPPDYAGSGSFLFQLATGVVRCTDVPWSAFASAQPVALADLTCTVELYPALNAPSFSAPLATGTMRSTSTLDGHGIGTLDVFLDVPATDVTLVEDDGGAQHPAVVQASAVHGRSTWVESSCGDGGCGGINPAI